MCPASSVKVPFFDDVASYGHALLGFASVLLPSDVGSAVAFGFTLYQMAEAEPLADKVGDFAEFAGGCLVGIVSKGKK